MSPHGWHKSSYSSNNREAMDPIAELLSELSGVRCSAGGELNSSGPWASQLQQLQVQLQLEPAATGERTRPKPHTNTALPLPPRKLQQQPTQPVESTQPAIQSSRFLLTRLNDPKMSETENWSMESECTDHSLFVQELLLSTLGLGVSSSWGENEWEGGEDGRFWYYRLCRYSAFRCCFRKPKFKRKQ